MKNKIKILVLIFICGVCFFGTTACTNRVVELNNDALTKMPNPWINCGKDLTQASKIAGFTFPIKLSNYSVRAMKDMIEISYKVSSREFTLRKSLFNDNNGDISGDYNVYPVNKTVTLENGVNFAVRGDDKLFYVINFSASSGYYSLGCKQGMSLIDLQDFYKLIASTEEPSLSHYIE